MPLLWIIYVIYVLCLSCFLVCSVQPNDLLLEKGSPLYYLVCDVLLCFCHFTMICLGSGVVLDISIPNHCFHTYFKDIIMLLNTFNLATGHIKVSKGAKIRNRYNQVPHLTQDTNGKVTNSQKTPQTRAKRSALSQQVTTKHI